jgi:integrase
MHEDVLRNAELDSMLTLVEEGVVSYRPVKSSTHEDPFGFDTIKFKPQMIQCLPALLWLFGKRVTENLKLKRRDVRVEDGYLYIHFYILKKKSRKSEPIPHRKLKRITLDNSYVRYVLDYVETLTNPEDFLFSSEYSRSGHMSRQHAHRIIKGLNPKAWLHLFRQSLATEMAERGATEEELMSWFDWDRYETAHRYTKGGPKLPEKWSKRTF